jgi:RecA/RadA recombinase
MSKAKTSGPDFQDLILAHLKKTSPRTDAGGLYEVTKTSVEVMSKIQYVLTTGIPSYDEIVGGMPFGRIVELYGLEGCGKTALVVRCASRARRGFISEVIRNEDGSTTYRPMEPDEIEVGILYIDNERSLDDDGKLTVDGHKLDIIAAYCDTVDQLFKQIDDAIDGMDRAHKALKSKKISFLLVVVDTIASTANKQELEQAWGKIDFNRAPQQYSQGFRKLMRKVNSHNVCLICTNQVRTNYKAQADAQRQGRQLTGNSSFEYTSYGGFALRFYASHRVFMYAHQSKYKLVPTAQFVAGITVGFHSVKNRLRMPMRDGKMVLLFDKEQGGLSPVFSILETLVLLGGIELTDKKKSVNFECRFDQWHIVPTTFDPVETETTLDEDDEKVSNKRGRAAKKQPGFKYRADWTKFYELHKADIDLLWDAVIAGAFATRGLDGVVDAEPEDDDNVNPAMPELED